MTLGASARGILSILLVFEDFQLHVLAIYNGSVPNCYSGALVLRHVA
jgi:hypothetical protein